MIIMFIAHQFALIGSYVAELNNLFAYTTHAIATYTTPFQCGGLPTISDTFFTGIIKWLAKILSGVAILALAWSAFQQIQHRDWAKLGGEVIGILVLLMVISKADTIISTLMTMAGIASATC